MSKSLRVGFIVEGPTDFYVLSEIVQSLLGSGKSIVPQLLQPELSPVSAGTVGGGGWTSVYLWCRDLVSQTPDVQCNPLFSLYDVVVLQLDLDVAKCRYTDDSRLCHIQPPPPDDLPVRDVENLSVQRVSDQLEGIVSRWLKLDSRIDKLIFCLPAQSLETWIWVALFPDDPQIRRKPIETREDVETILQQKPNKLRFIRGGKKDVNKYKESAGKIAANWESVKTICQQAANFSAALS